MAILPLWQGIWPVIDQARDVENLGSFAGGNVSSEIAQKFAANGLGNSYMAFNTNYHDTGLFGVYVTVS